jgi:NADPH-dependent 2,4-dienoyl-CoA reductase/sulfur reductase-like enzyme
MKRLLVIGGSDAGISAGLRAREIDPSWGVTLVVADAFPNYSICGLPFFLSGETPRWESLAHRTRAEIENRGIELLVDTVAEAIIPAEHGVRVRLPNGSERVLESDRLVIGTGAAPVQPPIRGLDAPGVHLLHTMGESFAVHEHLTAKHPRTAVIIGGGYIGLEMADALRHRGLAMTLFEAAPAVLQTVDAEYGQRVQEELQHHGVHVRTSTPIESIELGPEGLVVRSRSHETVVADLVLVVTGVRPNVNLGHACGVALGEGGALKVNRRMETNVPDILAAGDCAETLHRLIERPTYLPLGTTAHKQGRVAGESAVGGYAEFRGSLGTQVVKIFELIVGRTGLREDEAMRQGFSPWTFESVTWDHKAYYPGASRLRIRVTGDRRSRRLLGAQLLGRYGAEVSKRLDVFATALFHAMTVDDVAHLDLSYTPPLGSPWDPVQTACMERALAAPASDPRKDA